MELVHSVDMLAVTRDNKPSPEKAPPSLTNHRLWSVAVLLAPPHADAKLQMLLDAVKSLLNHTSGTIVEARWLAAQVSVHTAESVPGPLAVGGGAPSSSSASGCSSLSSVLVVRPNVSTQELPHLNVMVYLLCGTAGKRKSTVKRSIELLMEKMATGAAAQKRCATLPGAAGVCL